MLKRCVAVVLTAGLMSLGDAPVGAFVAGPKPLLGGMCLSLFRTTAVLNEGNSTLTTFDPASGFDAPPANVLSGPHTGLRAPRSFAYGANDRIVVGVPSRSAILRFDPAGGAQANGDVAPSAFINGAQSPLGFSVTETSQGMNSQLYLGNYLAGTAASVPFLSTGPGQFTTLASGIARPDATLVDRLGNVWVASYGSNTVSRFAPGSLTPNLTIANGISGPFALARGYWDLAAAPNVPIESLFVTNYLSNSVGIYDITSGAPVTQISGFQAHLDHPTGIAYDQNLDMIAVANYNTDSIVEFFAPPTLGTNVPVGYLGGPHTRLNHPVALWFGNSPSSIPAVQTDVVGTPHRDVEYPAAGTRLFAMERARDGNIYGIDPTHNSVVTISAAGRVTSATVPTPNAGLSDLTADPDGPVWFVEHAAAKIGKFTPPNTFAEYPIPSHDLPQSIAFNGLGQLLVTLPVPHKIAIFSAPGGGYAGSVGIAGGSPRWIVSLDSGVVVDYIDNQQRNWLEPIYVGIPGGTLGLSPGLPTVVPGMHGVGRMIVGPNCTVWFPETGPAIGTYSPNPPVSIREYATATRPGAVSLGDDGGIWFSEPAATSVVRANVLTGRIVSYPLPAGSRPQTLAGGGDGALWIWESGTQNVARFAYH
jgi:streptogramin lyase